MRSTMMDYPLVLPSILRRAKDVHPHKEIVTKWHDNSIQRYTYGEFYKRTIRLMNALRNAEVKPGDAIATFCLNHSCHLELYFAIPCIRAILHTINVRLFPEQLVYIINEAKDKFIFVDKSLTPVLEKHLGEIGGVKKFIIIDDKENVEPARLPNAISYDEFLAGGDEVERFEPIDELEAAGICYTSGTTGNPKGVVYSHRSTYLHSMAVCMGDGLGIKESEAVLPVVPMFHVNSWGIPFASVMSGCKLVFPGKHLLGAALAELLESEEITITAGVPTIWNVLYQHLKKTKYSLKIHTMVVGGSAAPRGLIEGFEKDFGIAILHAWGMTETSPIGTVSHLRSFMKDWDDEKRYAYRAKQGVPVTGVEIRAVDDEGNEVPKDGKTPGELLVRGPWITGSYREGVSKDSFTPDGWFRTGDVVVLDQLGYMQITDRKKDLIKTRGEWISSVDMENLVMADPDVLEAAVIGRKDPVREEAPVIFVVALEGKQVDAKRIHDRLKESFAHWQLPKLEDIRAVSAIPKTSVGKFDKKNLRKLIEE
ncbi:AMP-binding enzyme [Leptospira inadai serovar Lyme str. 10]|uniref:AMP-binding enzyme n=2 Tax=Leptospira inadai serovar Lyme TaxID=293084 RepID=V6H9Z1_9LEPT|nr:long-chain fatty acid--CoA ligase [Leptospira inadai]EQA35088.1 AMP-binding enzyme [Leptospira inadai serovar Lyme str. 10]PNV75276.1 acyl-CoA synthetase [Leptospira inadai serovar Lyme]